MTQRSQSIISSARRSAKAEVRGASPRESTTFSAPVPQKRQGEFCKLVFVGASPTKGSILRLVAAAWQAIYGDHDVTAASRPVKAFVPVRIRLVTPIPISTFSTFNAESRRRGWLEASGLH